MAFSVYQGRRVIKSVFGVFGMAYQNGDAMRRRHGTDGRQRVETGQIAQVLANVVPRYKQFRRYKKLDIVLTGTHHSLT
jgi:hypothetical protein